MGDPFSSDHLGSWMPGSAGPSSGFGEGFTAGYNEQYGVNSFYGMEDEVNQRWQQSLFKLEVATGQRFDMPLDNQAMNNYVRASQGEQPSIWQQSVTFQGLDPTEAIKQREPFLRANDAIKGLNNPDIPTMEDIVGQVIQQRAAIMHRSAEVSETGGFGASLGQFAGAVVGSFSRRDPINVGTLALGGFGKTAAARIATEMGVMGGVVAAQEFGSNEPTRELLGEEPGSPFMNVLYAMVGAGVFRGGIEGVGRFIGKVNKGRLAPFLEQEATANESWINSNKLREVFEAQPQSPSARAGIHILDIDELVDEYNPYGDSEFGVRKFLADVEDIQRVVNGEPETAIARFLPEAPPMDLHNLDVNEELVRAARPDIVDQLDQAQARLNEIDAQISDTSATIGDISVSDAIARVDPESGKIAKGLEDSLMNSELTTPQRVAVQRELDQIVEQLGGPQRIANAAKEAAELPRNDLGALRSARHEAAQVVSSARKQFDNALEQIQKQQKIIEAVNKPVVDGPKPLFGPRLDPSAHRPDSVTTRTEAVTKAEEALEETSESLAKGLETDEGIDVGNGQIIDFEFKIADPEDPSKEITARALAQQIKDDEALVAAMKECSV